MMYRTPHNDHDGMKVWLAAEEVKQFLALVDRHHPLDRVGPGLRCGLRSGEIVAATPADVADGPAGTMLRVREDAAKGDKYRETLVPSDLATTIWTVDEEAGASQVGS